MSLPSFQAVVDSLVDGVLNLPTAPRTITEFGSLLMRVEQANPGMDSIAVARAITKTRFDSDTSPLWILLPSVKAASRLVPLGALTADDVKVLLREKFTISGPDDRKFDPLHVIGAIAAASEDQPAGGPFARLGLVWPPGLPRLDLFSWAGDVGKAAAYWAYGMAIKGNPTPSQDELWTWSASPEELRGDIDGVAIAGAQASDGGYFFDRNASLSVNLRKYYYPSAGDGYEGRFHMFCRAAKFELEGQTSLQESARALIDERVQLAGTMLGGLEILKKNTTWDGYRNDRAEGWRFFSTKFQSFVEHGLVNEG